MDPLLNASYHCSVCKRTHNTASKIGREHRRFSGRPAGALTRTDAPKRRVAVYDADGRTRLYGPVRTLDEARTFLARAYSGRADAEAVLASVRFRDADAPLRRAADEDRAGGRNTLTRDADTDAAS